MKTRLYKIKLYGLLKKKFSTKTIEIYGKNVQDAFAGLQSRFGDDFKNTILNGAWHITLGQRSDAVLCTGDTYLAPEEVLLPVEAEELHVFPAVTGSGGNTGRIILGIVLIIVAVALWWAGSAIWAAGTIMQTAGSYAGAVALAGVASLAGGIAGMLAASPGIDNYADPDARQSFIFNGAVNNTEQGVPVPLVYGRHLTGSTVISAGIHTEQLLALSGVGPKTWTSDDGTTYLLGDDYIQTYKTPDGRELIEDEYGNYYYYNDADQVVYYMTYDGVLL